MPTENRSSNTDPRDVFIRLNPLGLGEAQLRKDSTGFEDQRTHSDYLLFLAGYRESHPEPLQHTEQHQGEPVALKCWSCRAAFTLKDRSDCDGCCWKCGVEIDLEDYAEKFAGEIERLRAENEAFDAGMRNLACQLSAGGYNSESLTADQLLEKVQWGLTNLTEAQARLVDVLRAQLAEQDVLLREAYRKLPLSESILIRRISAALSASAEPSAPIAWHVGGNGYDRICFEKPADLPGRPCVQAIHDLRQLIDLLKRYDLRDEDVPPDERAHGIPGTSFQRLNALANQGE